MCLVNKNESDRVVCGTERASSAARKSEMTRARGETRAFSLSLATPTRLFLTYDASACHLRGLTCT